MRVTRERVHAHAAVLVTASLLFPALSAQTPQPSLGGSGNSAPLSVNLTDALQRARAFSPQFLASGTAASLAREDRVQAKAARLPTLDILNQHIYTQGNGTPEGVFVANNGVHVYDEQAVVHAEVFSWTKQAEYRRAIAAEAAARARQDVALRGLAITVVQNYYAVVLAQRHLVNARTSLDEARRFEDLTARQETAGEVARADVVKAQIQRRQRERDLAEAETNVEKAKIGLAVLLFADIAQPYSVVDDLRPDTSLPGSDQARQQALASNPDVRAAEAGVQEAGFSLKAARGAYYPSLTVDYFFGIDANVFAFRGPDGRQNLGSVLAASVNVPVWNWGSTRSKVRQAETLQRQAELDLNFARRQTEANFQGYYLEARAAQAQLASLRDSVDLAAESLRLANLRYQGGEATALEVVDAQTTATSARDAYDAGLARYQVALSTLQTLTGTLAP